MKPGSIRIWSVAYLRFWVVKTLTRANPLALFVGSPIYVVYLRLLGAKIGKGVVIFERHVPGCPDLLTVGDNTVIHKDTWILGYRAHAGDIMMGPVTLGRNVLVSEMHPGHRNVDGRRQPARTCVIAADGPIRAPGERYGTVPLPCGPAPITSASRPPRAAPAGGSPIACSSCSTVWSWLFPRASSGWPRSCRPTWPPTTWQLGSYTFFLDVIAVTLVVFIGGLIVGLVGVVCVPRLLNRFLKPDVVYPLYGWHYSIHRLIVRLSNVRFYKDIFGDSSYIVHYLKALGWDLGKVQQTGSNFGPTLAHELPFLSSVGTGTMVSDGLNVMNADYTSTSFPASRGSTSPATTSWETASPSRLARVRARTASWPRK